ncbi:hypothetical protein [Rhodocyclus tenuis]|uniref:Uncharacterized protein n=1 Tax=Rhodocyclus tenuis TaxID=1066 RepID=A0A840GEF3_RHOTE|nr:hypothetical protein [Rhodocyclus tenuis]MBB4246599.1 hypothetical protein [Rhodocyclus tenuis]
MPASLAESLAELPAKAAFSSEAKFCDWIVATRSVSDAALLFAPEVTASALFWLNWAKLKPMFVSALTDMATPSGDEGVGILLLFATLQVRKKQAARVGMHLCAAEGSVRADVPRRAGRE